MTRNLVDPASALPDYLDYVEQYRVASGMLSDSPAAFWLILQVRGLPIEPARESYLCSAGHIVEGHDLVALAKQATDHGLRLDASDLSERIEKVDVIHFRYQDWNAKCLSRYPKHNRGMGVWVTPGHAILDQIIIRITDQARERAKDLTAAPPNPS